MNKVNPPVKTSNPKAAVKHWFALMERYCASVDYDGAEGIFAEDVVSFGTTMEIVSGRSALRRGQWESIWGNITNFKMDLDNVHANGSGNQAWGVVTWTSIGFRWQPPAVLSARQSDRYARTAGRRLAGITYALFALSRDSSAYFWQEA